MDFAALKAHFDIPDGLWAIAIYVSGKFQILYSWFYMRRTDRGEGKRIRVENHSVVTASCHRASVTCCLQSEEWRGSLNSRVKRKEEGHIPKLKIINYNDLVWVQVVLTTTLVMRIQRNVCFSHQRATLHVRTSSCQYHVSSFTSVDWSFQEFSTVCHSELLDNHQNKISPHALEKELRLIAGC